VPFSNSGLASFLPPNGFPDSHPPKKVFRKFFVFVVHHFSFFFILCPDLPATLYLPLIPPAIPPLFWTPPIPKGRLSLCSHGSSLPERQRIPLTCDGFEGPDHRPTASPFPGDKVVQSSFQRVCCASGFSGPLCKSPSSSLQATQKTFWGVEYTFFSLSPPVLSSSFFFRLCKFNYCPVAF